jgi:phosphoglycolate phosphatase
VTGSVGPAPRRGRLIAFDLDGTLVDSRQDLADSANQLVVERGGRPLTQDAVVGMVGEGASVLVRRALAGADLPDDPAALGRFLEIYDERLLRSTRLYPGVIELVESARQHAHVAVLTNKPLRHTERLLDGLHVRPLFDGVVGGDGPYARKPSADGLRALMAEAGAPEQHTLLVGDSMVDCDTAINAGVACCLVSWGFGFARVRRETLPPTTWIVHDAAALTSRIESLLNSEL